MVASQDSANAMENADVRRRRARPRCSLPQGTAQPPPSQQHVLISEHKEPVQLAPIELIDATPYHLRDSEPVEQLKPLPLCPVRATPL